MCGIFGIYNHPEASNHTYLGLYALQHRGQESTGSVSSDGKHLYHFREMGLVSEVFSKDILKKLPGKSAIGHVRYSTAGSSELKNAQPFVVDCYKGTLAIAHNGNLTNATLIKKDLESRGSIFQSDMDTEVIVQLIARFPPITHSCFFGIDTPRKSELIASSHTVKEIQKYITADSLCYLSLEGLKKCVKGEDENFCYACFTGDYPLSFQMELG